jgi:hypothetical protein
MLQTHFQEYSLHYAGCAVLTFVMELKFYEHHCLSLSLNKMLNQFTLPRTVLKNLIYICIVSFHFLVFLHVSVLRNFSTEIQYTFFVSYSSCMLNSP